MGRRCDDISFENFRRLFDWAGKQRNGLMYQLILLFEYQLGFRVGEAVTLRRRHVEDKMGRLKKEFVFEQPKTGIKRSVVLTEDIRSLLGKYLPVLASKNLRYPESYLFPGDRAKKVYRYGRYEKREHLNRVTVYMMIRRGCRELEIAGTVANHSMRRSFAGRLVEYAQKSLPELNAYEFGRQGTGHSSIDRFMIYVRPEEHNPMLYIDRIFKERLTE